MLKNKLIETAYLLTILKCVMIFLYYIYHIYINIYKLRNIKVQQIKAILRSIQHSYNLNQQDVEIHVCNK